MERFFIDGLREVLQDLLVPEFRALRDTVAKQGKRLEKLDTRLSKTNETLVSMSQQLGGLDGRLAALQDTVADQAQRLERLDARLGTLSQQLGGLDGRLAALQETVAGQAQRLERLDDRLSKTNETLVSMSQQLGGLDGRLAALERALVAVSNLQQDMSALKGSVGEAHGKLDILVDLVRSRP